MCKFPAADDNAGFESGNRLFVKFFMKIMS